MTRCPARQTLATAPAAAPRQDRTPAWRRGLPVPAFALHGCGSMPPAKAVSALQLHVQQRCADASRQSDGPRLLEGRHRLLQRNDGLPLQLCEADPQTRACTGDDLGHFVLGGVLPGRGSSSTTTTRQARMDAAQQTLHCRTSMSMHILGIGLRCDEHDATLGVASPGRKAITDSDHACHWMVVGTGNGHGEGHAVIRSPRPLPAEEALSVLNAPVAGR